MQQLILPAPLGLRTAMFMVLMRGVIKAVPNTAIIIDTRVSALRSIAAVLHLASSTKTSAINGNMCVKTMLLRCATITTLILCFTSLSEAAHGQASSAHALVRELSACHPRLQGSALGSQQATIAAQQVEAQRLPTFSISADGFQQDGTTVSALQLNITVPIATFGVQAAREDLEKARIALERSTHEETTADHAYRYVDALVRQEGLISRKNIVAQAVTDQQGFVEQVRRRQDAGSASTADVLQIEASLAQLTSQRNQIDLELLSLEAELRELQCPRMDTDRLDYDLWRNVLQYNGDLRHNAAVRTAEAQIVVAQKNLALEQISNRPTIQMEASATARSDRTTAPRIGLTSNFEYQNIGRSLGLQVRGRDLEVQRAILELEQVQYETFQRLNLIEGQINLFEEVTRAHQGSTTLILETTLASHRRLFDAGRISMNELLSAFEELMRAKLELSQMETDTESHILERFFLLGGFAGS